MNARSFLAAALVVSASTYASEPCIHVRTQADAGCLRFSEAERRVAISHGVQLGMPYAKVKQRLEGSGWHVDKNWLRERPEVGRMGELLCGAGYDATCTTAMVRGTQHIYITLGGPKGNLLIGIADQE
jgi:hypothetical protein